MRLAPYGLTAAVIMLILNEYPLEQIVAEMAHGDARFLLPTAMLTMLQSLFLVSAADLVVVRACVKEPTKARASYYDLLRAKAGSSLLDVFNYALGHGAYGVWIARFTGIQAHRAGGVMLYIMASDLAAVCSVASIALLFAQMEEVQVLSVVAPSIAGVLLFCVWTAPYKLLGTLPRIFEPWLLVPRLWGQGQIVLSMVQMMGFVVMTWVAARSFGLDIPFSAMAVYLPILLLLTSLPINVAGFGAVQGVWLLFFKDYATGPQILAFHALWSLASAAAVVLRGLPFVRRVVREVDGVAADESGARRLET